MKMIDDPYFQRRFSHYLGKAGDWFAILCTLIFVMMLIGLVIMILMMVGWWSLLLLVAIIPFGYAFIASSIDYHRKNKTSQ